MTNPSLFVFELKVNEEIFMNDLRIIKLKQVELKKVEQILNIYKKNQYIKFFLNYLFHLIINEKWLYANGSTTFLYLDQHNCLEITDIRQNNITITNFVTSLMKAE